MDRKQVKHTRVVFMCGGKPTKKDIAEVERFWCYLKGEMTLTEAREYSGLSVGQVAELANVSTDKVRAIESGHDPDEITTKRLMKLYGITNNR